MFCKKCGAEIADNSVFCEHCGAKVEEMPVDTGYADEGHGDSETEEQRSKKEKNKGRKKGRRIGIIVGVVLALACVGVGLTFMLRKGDADGKIGDLPKAKTPQEQALHNYFSAIKAFDMNALAEACYPKELIDENITVLFENYGKAIRFSNKSLGSGLGFDRGPVYIDNNITLKDFSEVYQEELEVVYESYPEDANWYYGYLASEEGDDEKAEEYWKKEDEYVKQSVEKDSAKLLFTDFNVTYNLLSMDKLSDCTINYIQDMNGKFESNAVDFSDGLNIAGIDQNVSADDVYVARVQVEWAYGDKLYGWDKNWWNDEKFTNWVVGKHITQENTYESIIDQYKNQEYVFFIYPQNGNWYVYPRTLPEAKQYQVE